MGAHSPRQSLVVALATGVVSVVPIGRAPRRVRAAVVAGTGLVAGGAMFTALNRPHVVGFEQQPTPARPAAAIGAVVGAAAAGAMAVGVVLDREAEQFLVRRGVRRPRLVLGVAGAVLSYVFDALDRRFDTAD
ncbi:hypothetical protein GL325_05365 [Aeromicrobium sp. 636]|uniref:Uncharacterized protein n=1 Tax=Aeromicrobium senzhongii TaxID=2663859 RepID=A0A8I0K2F3_9ACTN|nr:MULTISPECIES: hypothetical protein [Aeromicrobium]MBC9225745.1 hypothetical protein [Aeromicrobium senzhongii]MCQ3997854.1 hypothetical protein [Aeromicrobium sp. 636]